MTTLSTPRGRQALAVSIVFTTLATFITAARIYTRAFLVKQMGADDYVILVSLAFSWIFFGLLVGGEFQFGLLWNQNRLTILQRYTTAWESITP